MNLSGILPLALAAVSVLESGCRHAARSTSFEFVDPSRLRAPTDASKLRIEKARTIFVDAAPIEPLARPAWPNLRSSPPPQPATLKVRILVGEDGRVHGLEKSLADFSVPSHFSAHCFDEIGVAVEQWRFEPAQMMMLEPQEDGRPLVVHQSGRHVIRGRVHFFLRRKGRFDDRSKLR